MWKASSYTKWQATKCPPPTSLYSGTCSLQMSLASGHLVWNLHPFGGFAGLGISPSKIILSLQQTLFDFLSYYSKA